MRKVSGPANYPSDRIPVGYFGAVKRTSSGTIGYAMGGALLAMGTILTIAGFFLGRCAVHVETTRNVGRGMGFCWALAYCWLTLAKEMRHVVARFPFHAQDVRIHGKEWNDFFLKAPTLNPNHVMYCVQLIT
jgi:hypothetical protein